VAPRVISAFCEDMLNSELDTAGNTIGGSSFVIRWWWMSNVWPILRRFKIVSCLLEQPGGGGHGSIDF